MSITHLAPCTETIATVLRLAVKSSACSTTPHLTPAGPPHLQAVASACHWHTPNPVCPGPCHPLVSRNARPNLLLARPITPADLFPLALLALRTEPQRSPRENIRPVSRRCEHCALPPLRQRQRQTFAHSALGISLREALELALRQPQVFVSKRSPNYRIPSSLSLPPPHRVPNRPSFHRQLGPSASSPPPSSS